MKTKLLSVVACCLLSTGIVACGSQSTSQTNPSSNTTSLNSTSTNDTKPTYGGTLKVDLNSEPQTLNPYVWGQANDRNIFLQIFNSLMEYDDRTGQIVPGLIKNTQVSSDGLTYTLTIQSGVTFHNGKTMTADDINYSLQQAMNPKASRTAPLLAAIKDIQVKDPGTLVLTLKNRDSYLLDAFVDVYVTPDDPSIDQSTHPVGTGPFQFVKWDRNQDVVLKKFEGYWKKGLPYLNEIDYAFVPDSQVELLQLLNGQADFIDIVATSGLQQASQNRNIQLIKLPDNLTLASYITLINNSKPIFNNPKFRQAVNYALDRNAIKTALFGNFVVRSNPIPNGFQAYNSEATDYQQDLTKAKQLLQESGYNGQKVQLLYHNTDPAYGIIAQIATQSLQKIGVNVDLVGLPIAQWVANVFNQKQFDLALTAELPKPNSIDLLQHAYAGINGNSIQWGNKTWYDNLAKVGQLPPDQGIQLLKQLDTEVVDQSPAIIVGGYVQSSGASIHVQGFLPDPQNKLQFESAWKN